MQKSENHGRYDRRFLSEFLAIMHFKLKGIIATLFFKNAIFAKNAKNGLFGQNLKNGHFWGFWRFWRFLRNPKKGPVLGVSGQNPGFGPFLGVFGATPQNRHFWPFSPKTPKNPGFGPILGSPSEPPKTVIFAIFGIFGKTPKTGIFGQKRPFLRVFRVLAKKAGFGGF